MIPDRITLHGTTNQALLAPSVSECLDNSVQFSSKQGFQLRLLLGVSLLDLCCSHDHVLVAEE